MLCVGEGRKGNILSPSEYIFEMLKNFLRQSSAEESGRSTFVSKIDRGGREANVACVVAVAVPV
ncbi:unnamed protein product [Wuchereria bancrofti]|uniref:Uncharacterized protein n=1 Tax=Wuchereria bancrofti TaxID=6293 RepID=A0A3P7DYV4_WUCBA|nr:unnamed protein product [Wuchereria bancrofti]